ncbi:transposase, partial [Nocardia brasiliensis]
LLYAYCVGVRSSRAIERACHTDVAFRIACAQDVPDHTVIARFRGEYSDLFAELFSQVLLLCAKAGMVRVGIVALDGTKIAANASIFAHRSEATLRRMADQIIAEAQALDQAEDATESQDGDPPATPMNTRAERKETIRAALASIEAERTENPSQPMRESQRRLDHAQRRYDAVLADARARRLAQQEAIARGQTGVGRHRKEPEKTHRVAAALARVRAAQEAMAAKAAREPGKKRNLTDPECRIMKTRNGFIAGYNAQIVGSEDHVIIAAELSDEPADMRLYTPMVDTALVELSRLTRAGHPRHIGTVTADAGYCSGENLTAAGPDRVIAVSKDRIQRDNDSAAPQFRNPALQAMSQKLRTPQAAAIYKRRGALVEPLNAHLKDRRGLTRFARRGLHACAAELKLAAAATNLMRYITYTAAHTT